MPQNPQTLPADFFSNSQDSNPDTLPSDFSGWLANNPAPTPDQLRNNIRLGMNSQRTEFERTADEKVRKANIGVKALTSPLPILGAVGGGVAGAPAFGAGALVGAGLGGAAGESARLAVNRMLLGESEPSPISKQGLKDTAIAGATSAAFELPGAVMSTAGRALVTRIAAAKEAKQVGDAVEGIMQSTPGGFTRQMLTRDVQAAAKQDAIALRDELSRSTSMVNVDTTAVKNARAEAMFNDTRLPGTLKRFDRMVEAAKINSGIKGNTATPQQLYDFMRQFQKPGFTGTPGPVSEVLKNLSKTVYRDSGQTIRMLSPNTDQIFSRLSNFYAAENALKNYKPGLATSLAVSAAANPKATALISPVAAGAAAATGKQLVGAAKKAVLEPFEK